LTERLFSEQLPFYILATLVYLYSRILRHTKGSLCTWKTT